MARVLIVGGHGKVARLLSPLLSERGHTVTALIRDPEHTNDVSADGAEPAVVDVTQRDRAELAALLAGHDAVVWAAGAGGGDSSRTYAVDRDAAMRCIDAAGDAGVARFVMISYFGSHPSHGIAADHPFYAYAEAKAAADTYLRASRLEWTIVGPSALTRDPAIGRIDVDAEESRTVSRADVAGVVTAVLEDDSTIHRTIRFNSGSMKIVEAIRA